MTTEFTDVLQERIRTVSASLEGVREREAALRSEYAERLREISEEVTRLEAELRHLGALLALESRGREESETGRQVGADRVTTPVDLREEVYRLLSEVREPMHYTQMAEQMILRGVHVPGREPAKNLVAHIHNDPRFKRPKRGFYGLTEWYPRGTPSVGARRTKASPRRRALKATKEVRRQ